MVVRQTHVRTAVICCHWKPTCLRYCWRQWCCIAACWTDGKTSHVLSHRFY